MSLMGYRCKISKGFRDRRLISIVIYINPLHTQTIRWQQRTNCLSVLDHFAGLALKRLSEFERI